MKKKFCVDIGHGGKDSGACANGLAEKNLNLEIGLRTEEYLKPYDVEILLTRSSDISLTPTERTKLVLDFNPDLCVSIHHNSFNRIARGAEAIHAHYETQDDFLANDILNRLEKVGMPKRRAFTKLNAKDEDWYYMIREINDKDTDSIIFEGGFIDNVQDANLLKTEVYKDAEARAIAFSVVDYLWLTLKQQTVEKSWEQVLGEKAIDTLVSKGKLNNPQSWKSKDLKVENTPLWLFFEMTKRFYE